MALRFVYILVTQEFQNLQLSVGYRTDVQQFRIVVDESGVAVSGTECRVVQHVQEESDVGLYAFDTHLRQRTNRLVDGVVKTTSVRTYFYQQAVVVRGDYRSGKTISAVQTNSESRCGTVLRDGTGIRCKVVGRILSGDTALNGITVHGNVLLGLDVDSLGIQGITLGNQNHILNDIDARYQLRNRVLYLNTGVHFDEVVLTALVQQKLASSGTAVIHCFCQLDGIIADGFSLRVGQAERRCELDDLLVSSLYGAISLIKVHQVAVLIAQHLNLNMLRLFQVFLDKNISVAECFYRFVMGTAELRNQFFAAANDSHSSSAAAGSRLQHYRITALLCKFQRFILGRDGLIHARDGRNANAFRYQLGLDFITQRIHHLMCRSDEFDAALLASFRETGIFCQESITRVNGIAALCLC